jgi:hypothetical protein
MCEQFSFRYELPVVQFRSLHDFIVDLAAGTVLAVYHDFDRRSALPLGWNTLLRALVADEHPHIAAVAFQHLRLLVSDGKIPDDETQRRHQAAQHDELMTAVRERLVAVGIEEERIRRGQLSVPYSTTLLYARNPILSTEEPSRV